jgi:Ca2+-binding RTX toxin-like protein
MRKTLLLLTTMALALLVAGGVALAAPVTCQVGVTCKGTSSADTITGTTSNDTIKGLGGNDTISALDGIDKIDGGTQNDTMDGGAANDSYRFSNNFGVDSISADSAGVDTIDFSRFTTSGVGFGLTGPTACPPTQPLCIALGGNFIENLIGTGFTDTLTGNPSKNQITSGDGGSWDPNTGNVTSNESMDGLASADTYKGYTPGGPANGVDLIRDTGGSTNIDKLTLTQFNLGDARFFKFANTPNDVNQDTLVILLPNNELIFLWTYFQGTSTDACANASGTGLIEKISFADDPNVDFAQVKQLLNCSATGSAPTGTTQVAQSFTQPEFSNGTNGVATNLNGTNGVATNLQR